MEEGRKHIDLIADSVALVGTENGESKERKRGRGKRGEAAG